LFPTYDQHVHYAALSADGRALTSYGCVAVCWNVTTDYLERRISLLDENSFFFYVRYDLGSLGSEIPPGHRATWVDRVKLAVAKASSALTIDVDEKKLAQLLLGAGATRNDDNFIEIAIYADRGLDAEDVNKVTLQRRAVTLEETHRLELVRESCRRRKIDVIE